MKIEIVEIQAVEDLVKYIHETQEYIEKITAGKV